VSGLIALLFAQSAVCNADRSHRGHEAMSAPTSCSRVAPRASDGRV